MIYIENEGALFRSQGFMTENPDEVFSAKTGEWEPYQGQTPKPPGWVERLTAEEALAMMARMRLRQAALR